MHHAPERLSRTLVVASLVAGCATGGGGSEHPDVPRADAAHDAPGASDALDALDALDATTPVDALDATTPVDAPGATDALDAAGDHTTSPDVVSPPRDAATDATPFTPVPGVHVPLPIDPV